MEKVKCLTLHYAIRMHDHKHDSYITSDKFDITYDKSVGEFRIKKEGNPSIICTSTANAQSWVIIEEPKVVKSK